MKKVLVSIFIFVVILIMFGCRSSSPAVPAPQPTATPNNVTFHITNNSSTYAVDGVFLDRNSTAVEYYSYCSIPIGTSVNVSVIIPANETYNVLIRSNSGTLMLDEWDVFPLTQGTTYNVTISGASSTINSVVCNSGPF